MSSSIRLTVLSALLALSLSSTVVLAQTPATNVTPAKAEEKLGYSVLQTPVGTDVEKGKIEVLEIFWYGCGHCYALEGPMNKWEASKPEGVEFIRLPALFGDAWDFDGQVYLTLEAMGVLDKAHQAYFDALQRERKRMRSASEVATYLADKTGISKEDFLKTWDSFAVKAKMTRAKDLVTKRYNLDSVPVVIVQGKYMINAETAGGTTKIPTIINPLVEKVKKEEKQ